MLDKQYELTKSSKDFQNFIKSDVVRDFIKKDCAYAKADQFKRKLKHMANPILDDNKFTEKQ